MIFLMKVLQDGCKGDWKKKPLTLNNYRGLCCSLRSIGIKLREGKLKLQSGKTCVSKHCEALKELTERRHGVLFIVRST